MINKFIKKTISKITHHTNGYFTLSIDNDGLTYETGQFARLGLLNKENKLIAKPYSYASNPNNDAEFYIVEVTGGAISPQLKALKVGDTVYVDKTANGQLYPENIKSSINAWFFVTGTGVGVPISLCSNPEFLNKYKEVFIVHNVKCTDDLHHNEILANHKKVNYIPFISQGDPDNYNAGRFTDNFKELMSKYEGNQELTALKSQVIIIGNPSMLKETVEFFKTEAFSFRGEDKNIYVERYW